MRGYGIGGKKTKKSKKSKKLIYSKRRDAVSFFGGTNSGSNLYGSHGRANSFGEHNESNSYGGGPYNTHGGDHGGGQYGPHGGVRGGGPYGTYGSAQYSSHGGASPYGGYGDSNSYGTSPHGPYGPHGPHDGASPYGEYGDSNSNGAGPYGEYDSNSNGAGPYGEYDSNSHGANPHNSNPHGANPHGAREPNGSNIIYFPSKKNSKNRPKKTKKPDRTKGANPEKNSDIRKGRVIALLVVFVIIIIALGARVGHLQFVQGKSLSEMAYQQQNLGIDISPKRGAILDRNGKELAVNAAVETITISPNEIRKSISDRKLKKADVISGLAEILGLDESSVSSKIEKDSVYEVLIKKIEIEDANKVRKFVSETNLKGVYINEDSKRFYRNNNLAAHIIGMTGDDNQGLSGIEYIMESYIKGVPGRIMGEVDARSREVPFGAESRVEPRDGLNVVLTIDSTIQYFATKALESAIEENSVRRGGVIVIMDPRNGDVLALVSKPDFDLNDPFAAPPGYSTESWNGRSAEGVDVLNKTLWRNKAIMDTYEPGSTFKAVTASAGLEEGAVTIDSVLTCKPFSGYYTKDLNCWVYPGSHGTLDLPHAVYNSCNPAFMSASLRLGVDTFYQYVRDFGFYDKTGIILPGEVSGLFQAEQKELDMLVASFGQRFTVTPMQLITAYAAIANGGNLMKPRLVKELTDSDGNVVTSYAPEVIRKVISKETSDELRGILEGVVTEGTGRNAYVSGYRVAGKTGTSETLDDGRYIASFCSFAPADNPVVCALVMLDEPTGKEYMGGAIAAPVAQKLLEDILIYLEVEREYSEKDKKALIQEVYVPEVRNMSAEDAVKEIRGRRLEYKVIGADDDSGKKVLSQTPAVDARVPVNSTVFLYTGEADERPPTYVPDLMNKTVYEATEALKKNDLNIRISGFGVAKTQSPHPGAEVPEGSIVEVSFIYMDNIE